MATTLVIFGITGDLSRRKLLPALDDIVRTGEYDDLSIVGVSRRDVAAHELLAEHPRLYDKTEIFTMDVAEVSDYHRLRSLIESREGQHLYYLAVPPGAAADIADFLGESGLTTPQDRILFEKPFGFDLTSAREFVDRTARYFPEDQVYRIDHYMAKEVAQELIRLRSDASSHHHRWGNQSIALIDVLASEAIGVEGRGQFYEQTGALRDFLQGHLMQVLSLVLMKLPQNFELEELAHYRLEALQALRLALPENATRAQYEGYQEEVGNIGSLTETYVSVSLESNDSNWDGVSIRLTTGKSLDHKESSVTVTYTDGTIDVFDESVLANVSLNAYARVLMDAIASRKTIFTTAPEVIRAWEILQPVLDAWTMDDRPLPVYKVGTNPYM